MVYGFRFLIAKVSSVLPPRKNHGAVCYFSSLLQVDVVAITKLLVKQCFSFPHSPASGMQDYKLIIEFLCIPILLLFA